MIKSFKFIFLGVVVCVFMTTILTAQDTKPSKSVDKYFDESGGFVHKLWYGGGFNLGFSGTNDFSQFNIGITPMVGYKVLPFLSFGPRIGFDYSYIKGDTYSAQNNNLFYEGRKSANLTTYSIGIFGRLKFLRYFLIHSEANYQSIEGPNEYGNGYLAYDKAHDKISTQRINRENYLVGGGYNSGDGLIGYEILFLYNFSVPVSSRELPWDLRFGFTYKF